MKRKDFGQHFLTDPNIIEDELNFAQLQPTDVILEIGPGKGALTIPLSKQVKQVIAIEKDPLLCHSLQSDLPSNIQLICADAVTYDFSTLPAITKIVSNLPYKISSPITFKFLSTSFKKAVLIYQKEFAKRMVASPNTKHYSRLSVGIYYHAVCRILKKVPRTCFTPPPKIESCIVELIPRSTPAFQVKDEQFFFDVTTLLFNHRRKQIKNIIRRRYQISPDHIPFSDIRVEQLSPEQIGFLSDELFSQVYEKEV